MWLAVEKTSYFEEQKFTVLDLVHGEVGDHVGILSRRGSTPATISWDVFLRIFQEGLLIGFALFRLFDIWKPFPIGWVDQKVPGALGTMLDDVIAGLFAIIILLLVNFFIL